MSDMQLEELTATAIELAIVWVPQLIYALVTLIVGFWIVGVLVRSVVRLADARQADPTLTRFLESLLGIGLKALVLITVASMVGIATTSFIAVLGAAGLAVGLALQGSLSNFAGGVMVLLFRPYKVGDFIEAQGVSGSVAEIQIFNTIMKTADNKTIVVPNGSISNGIIVNYSVEPTRRVDLVVGVSYDADLGAVRELLSGLLAADERIHQDPAPAILVAELADSSVNFAVRAWVDAGNYWPVFFDLQERTKLALDEAGISIPYPHTEVHLRQL